MGLGEISLGKMGLGEMGLGEMGQNLDSRPEIVSSTSGLDDVTFCCSVVALSLLLCQGRISKT